MHVFGYASIRQQWLDDHKVLVNEIEQRTGLYARPATLNVSFTKEKPIEACSLKEIASLPVGQTKVAIKTLAREQKKAAKSNR